MLNSATVIAEKYDFNFVRTCRLRSSLQDVFSTNKDLYHKKLPEAKQSSIL